MNNKQILRELGFTEGEIKVYFALFGLGQSTVGPISRKSGITHAKVYPILTKLIDKGLASFVIKKGRKNFSATHPNSLLEFVDTKVRILEEEKAKIKQIIPSLLAKQKEQEEAQYSRVFEGFRGLRSLFYELFGSNKEKEKILVFGLNKPLKQANFISFFKFYHDLRKKNKIGLKLILDSGMKKFIEQTYQGYGYFSKNEVKYMDVAFPTGVFIFKDHVINIIAEEKVTAFDIKSKQNAQRYKKFFNEIWER